MNSLVRVLQKINHPDAVIQLHRCPESGAIEVSCSLSDDLESFGWVSEEDVVVQPDILSYIALVRFEDLLKKVVA